MGTEPNPNLDLIFGRRSIRVYAVGEVSEPTVTRLLEAAMAAPSAMAKDPWRFVVVRDREMLSRLTAALPGGAMLPTAALAIVVCGDATAAFERDLSFLLQDCSAAIENLLLAAHMLGLGGCWVGIHPGANSVRQVRDLLGLPRSVVPVAAVALGPPGEKPEPRTRYRAEHVFAEKWGQKRVT